MLVQHCGGRTSPIDNRSTERGAARASGKFLHVMWAVREVLTSSPSPLLRSGPNVQLLDHTAMSERKERLKEDEAGRGGARREHNRSGAREAHARARTLFATCLFKKPVNPTYCTMIGILAAVCAKHWRNIS
jgi:hypothetical protein